MRRSLALWFALFATACSPGTRSVFDLDGDLTKKNAFFNLPFPSDLRLDANGHPVFDGFPNPFNSDLLTGLLATAPDRTRWPRMPVAYFRFDAPLAARTPDTMIPADKAQPLLLLELSSGRLYPTVAQAGVTDAYLPPSVLAVSVLPGFVLKPNERYAVIVRRGLNDAAGKRLGVPDALDQLLHGTTPAGAKGAAAHALYADLPAALAQLGVPVEDVAAATIFTTGDVVAENAALGEAVTSHYSVTITNLMVDPDDGAAHDRYCELVGKVTYPQFQTGTPPFNTGGLFVLGPDGVPQKQRDEDAVVRITIPKGTMPPNGWPLVLYFHGSGGTSNNVVDRGPVLTPDGPMQKGLGPAYVYAGHGIAAASTSLPLSPERVPGAAETAYIDINNPAAIRDIFREGVVEQHLFAEALRTIQIPASTLAPCTGMDTAATHHFASDQLLVSGQSMGGMYTNLIGAAEPRIKAVVPTGAGGYWSYFVLRNLTVPGAAATLGAIFGTDTPTHLHPYMFLIEQAIEPADPMVSVTRLGLDPLPGHPARPVYEPVGDKDSYFPHEIYDAMALAYGHQQAGDQIWTTMQDALALDERNGILPYPITNNRTSTGGTPFTGVVVQYAPGIDGDGHFIYGQLDAVKHQYGCFFETFLKTGAATVFAPGAEDAPCN